MVFSFGHLPLRAKPGSFTFSKTLFFRSQACFSWDFDFCWFFLSPLQKYNRNKVKLWSTGTNICLLDCLFLLTMWWTYLYNVAWNINVVWILISFFLFSILKGTFLISYSLYALAKCREGPSQFIYPRILWLMLVEHK